MRKYIAFFSVLAIVCLLMPITVLGQDAVVISYEQALQMALRDMLPVMDADIQIRGMQDRHEDLTDELRLLEQGGFVWENLSALHAELWELEFRLYGAIQVQEQMRQNADFAMHEFLAGLAAVGEGGFNPALSQILQSAIQGMMGAQELSNAIAMMEMQRQQIFQEMRRIQNRELVDEMIDDARHGMVEIDRQIHNLFLQQEQIRLVRESALRGAIVAVRELDLSIYVAAVSLALIEEDLNRANIRYGFGLISTNDVRAAENAVAQAKMNMDGLIVSRNTAMQNLNHLLSAPLSQYTVVEFEREVFELPEEINFSGLIAETTTIRQLQIDVDRARTAMLAYTGDDDDIIATLREAYERAIMGRNQAKATMEVSMRRALNELENLMSQRDSLLIELDSAYLAMESVLTNLELSRATQYDVEQALLSIHRIRQRMETNFNAKWTLAFMLGNPSLLN